MKRSLRDLHGGLDGGRLAQGADVRIDVKSGAIARLPLRCEALKGPVTGTASARSS